MVAAAFLSLRGRVFPTGDPRANCGVWDPPVRRLRCIGVQRS